MEWQIDGESAWCYTGGKAFDPAQPCIVFMHGAQNDHSVFALQSRFFAHHGFSVLAPDLPAHGRSSGAPLTSIAAMADWLCALLQASGAQHIHLAGHSMGSLIALETARRLPQVRKLSLMGTAFPMRVADSLLAAARDDVMQAIAMTNQWSYTGQGLGIAQKPSCPGPGFYVQGLALRLKQKIARGSPHPVFYADLNACNQYQDGENTAAQITVPTQFILARADQMTPPKAAQGLRQQIAGHRLDWIEAAGHDMMAEQPDAVRRALLAFAREGA